MPTLVARPGRMLAVLLLVVSPAADAIAQQSALATLPEEPPTLVQYYLGPFSINPNLSVPEFGVDSNIFNESTSPKEDYILKIKPDIDLFADVGIFRVSAQAGAAFSYFHRYRSERSLGQNLRGRVTARLSRVRPWVGGASVVTHDRTDPEIDARVRRTDTELAAGAQFEVSPIVRLGVSANRVDLRYGDLAAFRGMSLAPALDRRTDAVAASLRLQATPFTSVTFNGYASRDTFELAPDRDARSRGGDIEVAFSPEAIIRGKVSLGFRDFRPDDSVLDAYRGLTGRGALTAIILGRGLLGLNYLRDVRYSFDRTQGYYVETGGDVVYTHRVVGPFDVQVRTSLQRLDFDATPLISARHELLHTYQIGAGYALENRSRIGLSYEYAKRVGETYADRPFARRRLFGSYSYEFWK